MSFVHVSIDSCNHNNTHQLTNVVSPVNDVDGYHSFLTLLKNYFNWPCAQKYGCGT